MTSNPLDPNSDAHLYLEEVEGAQALDWVRAQNERSLKVLEGDARYAGYYEAALKIATSAERIPYGSIRGGFVYNFWQDEAHERGLWRRTPVAEYAKAQPVWETLLDLDALSKAEGANWVYKGVNCLPPENVDCLLSLSDGGKDAARVREYSIAQGGAKAAFVAGGFDIPEAKSSITWQDKDTLLIATDWGGDTPSLTESGYPFVVKQLKRGEALGQAVEVYRGDVKDVAASAFALEDEHGKRWFGASRAETFFTSSYVLFRDGAEPVKIPLPEKASPQGVFADTLIATIEEDWAPEGQGPFKSGDLIGYKWGEFVATGKLPKVELVFRPTPKQALQGVGITKNELLVNISDNVVVKVMAYRKGPSGWTSKEVPLPPNGSAGVIFADVEEATAFLGFDGYLSPDSLFTYDTASGALSQIKALPAWFDASSMVVDQFDATSKDGTKVPYFVVRKKDIKYDGSNPTLVYGYGGFQVSQTPGYSGTVGKLWLEQGGVYVMANIRGGGEFGPAWHQAGLKTKRQVVYDDFIAVAEDVIAKKITSKEKLGAMGGSNGGLLMGVMFTQRPDLFRAIVCQVPLLDMLRYHLLLAGASWMDEYGDPDVPEERAFLEKLSPYHNVDPAKTYPEIYFETSTKDDRVHPGHARKLAKRLEETGKPFLYYENIDGGHSAAANQREAAKRAALEFTYLSRKLMDGK
ncbi:MAG TPA: prolyl oligopeptidase family serine peptidase, partial [Hyphomonadaceae bacterium]|nr:prolyl oligopeptidase family serine peptidase [Hyphomonadaceae bacterium]